MHASAAPIEFEIGRSRRHALLLAAATLAGMAAPFASGLASGYALAVAALVALAALAAWRRKRRWRGARLRVMPDRRVRLCAPGAAEETGTLKDAVLLGPMLQLTLALGSGTSRVVLWSDAVEPEAWRRLRVLLRHHRAPFSDIAG